MYVWIIRYVPNKLDHQTRTGERKFNNQTETGEIIFTTIRKLNFNDNSQTRTDYQTRTGFKLTVRRELTTRRELDFNDNQQGRIFIAQYEMHDLMHDLC